MNHLLHVGLIIVLSFIGVMGMAIAGELLYRLFWDGFKEMSDIIKGE
jgi:hypothetical protein